MKQNKHYVITIHEVTTKPATLLFSERQSAHEVYSQIFDHSHLDIAAVIEVANQKRQEINDEGRE